MKNLQKIGQWGVDQWQLMWGEGGVWQGIMGFGKTLLSDAWGEGGTWAGIGENLKTMFDEIRAKAEDQMDKVGAAIGEAKQFMEDIKTAFQNFWQWLQDHVFSFKISLPDLPEWAVPHSPIPLHTAWKEFGRYLDGATFEPDVRMADPGALASVANGLVDPVEAMTAASADREVVSIGGNTINNGMDLREFEARVRRIVRSEQGRK